MTMEDVKRLLLEAKQDEWRKNIDDEEYKRNSDLVDQLHRRNLEVVSQKNKNFKHTKYVKPSKCNQINPETREVYERWKEQNQRKKEVPEVCVENLLHLIHYLNKEPDKNEKTELEDCLKRQNSEFEIFWDCPSYILKIIRKCVLTRDWPNMTYSLLILLNYDKKYIPLIKKMCQIMVKFYPLIMECGLEDQFNAFLQSTEQELVVV